MVPRPPHPRLNYILYILSLQKQLGALKTEVDAVKVDHESLRDDMDALEAKVCIIT